MKTILVTHSFFKCKHCMVTGVFSLYSEKAGGAKDERAQPGQLTQNGQRDISHHMMSVMLS